MKLTKNQIKGKQEELVETILKLDALGGIASGCTVGGIGPNFFA